MPSGVYIRTEKHRASLRTPHIKARKTDVNVICLFCCKPFRVKPSWVKDRKFCSKRCNYSSPQYKENQRKIWLGRKHSEETKAKIRLANTGVHLGEKSKNWKGGKKSYWKKTCLERDKYECKKCGISDRRVLNVDHIKSKAIYPHLKFAIKNGVTLCANCHAIKTYYEDDELKNWKYDRRSKDTCSRGRRFNRK